MKTPEKTFADALHDAYTDLLRNLQELDHAVGSGSGEGPAELAAHLEEVREHLTEHFQLEEDGGYMAPLLKEEPRFAPTVKELLEEHRQMAATLDGLIGTVKG